MQVGVEVKVEVEALNLNLDLRFHLAPFDSPLPSFGTRCVYLPLIYGKPSVQPEIISATFQYDGLSLRALRGRGDDGQEVL